jgi:aminoglycoside phosphotransferase family enzyme/predicted kinase
MTPRDADAQRILIERLADPAFHGAHCRHVRVVETLISYVLLTGTYAYKIKKAVDLGFLDFTTLAARRFFCQEEVRLNRRLAPSLYLDVVAVTGTPEAPRFGGTDRPIEYAVRMREFPAHALLPAVIARNRLSVEQIGALGERIARFHQSASRVRPHTRFGTAPDVLGLALENFRDLRMIPAHPTAQRILGPLEAWTNTEYAHREALIEARRHHGFVRECHGDLHTGNIAVIENVATPFDCIEFSERMRWSDVMSDVAFLVMDLEAHGRSDLADRFLNRYLETSGDYEGLGLLRFFVVYRALVRAKVAMLRAMQPQDAGARAAEQAAAARFLRIAVGAAHSSRFAIVITHGVSGTGKTSVAGRLAAELRGIHVRADVERKRLFGLAPLARTRSSLGSGIYSAAATQQTYERLAALARRIAEFGYVAVIDASFLKRLHRDRFRSLAAATGAPFVIVKCTALRRTLIERITSRAARDDDASEADREVLSHQLETAEPLERDEHPFVVACDTSALPRGSVPRAVVEEIRRRVCRPISREPSAPGTSRGE